MVPDTFQRRRVVLVLNNLKVNIETEHSIYLSDVGLLTDEYDADLLVSKFYYPEACQRLRAFKRVLVHIISEWGETEHLCYCIGIKLPDYYELKPVYLAGLDEINN